MMADIKLVDLNMQLAAARRKANCFPFGAAEWEDAMIVVRQLVNRVNAATPKKTYCSIDSGVHPTAMVLRHSHRITRGR